jgi:adenylate kinase family enzyme
VRRISVVGSSGSGKSWLAGNLAEILGAPCLELDGVFHQRDWSPLPDEEFAERVTAAVAGEGWVIDGNYSKVRPLVWRRADTVIWLALPRRTVMRQIIARTLRRIITWAELWNGNRERWGNLFSLNPEESVIVWAWRTHAEIRERYSAMAADPAYAHLTFIRLASRAEVRRFLADLARCRKPAPPT